MAEPPAMTADLDEVLEGLFEKQNINIEALALDVEETRNIS